ncbi:MAG: cytochrome-c peroxidase [Planctomyces sp.]|nr:cytochrome-c peroxidase [Planctomyces sp.]MDP7275468.1 cytochrome c peroxidase [Planctomycetaceae bacterium]
MKMSLRAVGVFGVSVLCLAAVVAADKEDEPKVPFGLPPVTFPDDNPYSSDKVELGKLLYFDKRLSSDDTVSCATCHSPSKGFTDGAPVSTGIKGQKGGRSAPTVINRAYSTQQFWDGRAPSLEAQAIGPIANPIEMTNLKSEKAAHGAVVDRLKKIKGYQSRFKTVFGATDITIDHVGKAIATFERTVLSGNAPYDRFVAGDKKALSKSAKRGFDIFFKKAACDSCHLGFNFTDGSYENVGIGMDKPKPDLGRFVVTGKKSDRGSFKTPTLREIEHTGPYMHDGRFKTLEAVVEHYDGGGVKNPNLDRRIKPLKLSKREKKDLVSFLKALSGEGWQQIKAPRSFPK